MTATTNHCATGLSQRGATGGQAATAWLPLASVAGRLVARMNASTACARATGVGARAPGREPLRDAP